MIVSAVTAVALAFVAGCVSRSRPPAPPPPPLLLVSLDGFRWDYCDLYPAESPRLRELIRNGASTRRLIPVFPSNTFPNHYSIVTGLYPSRHGVINNEFFDPSDGAIFRYNVPAHVREGRWWGGEPVWVTAARHGMPSATAFWVGSEAEIGGHRPTYWKPYNYRIPFEERLDQVIAWLRLPEAQRPRVIAFYLEETNSVGHSFGPTSPETAAAVKLLDGRIASLLDRIAADGHPINVVIVSDHGMTEIAPERSVVLEDYIDASTQVDFDGSVVGLRALDGDIPRLLRKAQAIPHGKAFRTADLPARLRVGHNPRNPDVWVLADEGWEILRRATLKRLRERKTGDIRGDHGYDPALKSMHGILIAHGPSFKRGVRTRPVENVHVYNLLCAALGITPAPNDGDRRLVRAFLK